MLDQELRRIKNVAILFKWDCEYWYSYITQYRNQQIDGDTYTIDQEIKECFQKFVQARRNYKKYKNQIPEYFI